MPRIDVLTGIQSVTVNDACVAVSSARCDICRDLNVSLIGSDVLTALDQRWIAPRRHVTDPIELEPAELAQILRALRSAQAPADDVAVATLDVTFAAHLRLDPAVPLPLSPRALLAALTRDAGRARSAGLIVHETPRATVYAPYAPATSGEVRLFSSDPAAFRTELADLTAAFSFSGSPYSVALSTSPVLLARLAPAADVTQERHIVRDPARVAADMRLVLSSLSPVI